ncbi:unnamed protein product [Diplocarpon coronariae]|uniref:Uncharacterized protein n=1 Tax=Diplocarpon coronariae TaxID=2795749 RepID=A0A218YY80_9HELO|nr:hypothetical protein JHW43_008299 [Diplocarpon mali]OWP00303.1 hypothetical protein B2J93_3714 [Marssonina coronariae]
MRTDPDSGARADAAIISRMHSPLASRNSILAERQRPVYLAQRDIHKHTADRGPARRPAGCGGDASPWTDLTYRRRARARNGLYRRDAVREVPPCISAFPPLARAERRRVSGRSLLRTSCVEGKVEVEGEGRRQNLEVQ